MSNEFAVAFINAIFDLLKEKTKKYQVFDGWIVERFRERALKIVPELLGRLKAKGVIQ